MKPFVTSLKARIIAAVIAVAVIHAGFYTVPRWWYSMPRFYGDGYDRASAILKEEFGEKAVSAGVVKIPRQKVTIPYHGEALINHNSPWERLYISMCGPDCYLVREVEDGLECARVSRQAAESVWAEFEYLNRIEIDCPCRFSPLRDRVSYSDFSGWAFRKPIGTGSARPFSYGTAPAPADVARDIVRLAALEKVGTRGFTFSTRREDVLPALHQIIGASVPPREADYVRLGALVMPYAELEGVKAYVLLKHAVPPAVQPYSKPTPAWLQWLYRLPLFRPTPGQGDDAHAIYQTWGARVPRVPGLDWEYETLKGARDDEAFATASRCAFAADADYNTRISARITLAKRWPQEWKALAWEHTAELTDAEKAALLRRDRDFARLIALGDKSFLQVDDLVALYEQTGDASCIARLEEIVEKGIHTDAAKARDADEAPAGNYEAEAEIRSGVSKAKQAAAALADIYEKDKGAGDVPGFFRGLLREARSPFPRQIVYILAGMNDKASASVLIDLASDPRKVLTQDEKALSDADAQELRLVALGCLAECREAGVAETVAAVLDEGVTAFDAWAKRATTLNGTVHPPITTYPPRLMASVLGSIGNPCALPALKRALDACISGGNWAPGPYVSNLWYDCTTGRVTYDNPYSFMAAIEEINLRAAGDPAAYYARIDPTIRLLIGPGVLAKTMSKEQLQALLADKLLRETRVDVLFALYWLEVQGLGERITF